MRPAARLACCAVYGDSEAAYTDCKYGLLAAVALGILK
jgi:hypothetical protein